jgi:hypothetical protein
MTTPAGPATIYWPASADLLGSAPDVILGENGDYAIVCLAPRVTVHVRTAAQGRALADALTKAARLLEPRIDGSLPAGPQCSRCHVTGVPMQEVVIRSLADESVRTEHQCWDAANCNDRAVEGLAGHLAQAGRG